MEKQTLTYSPCEYMENRPVIILIEPQLGENVGFVARSMNNFGFKNLRIVNPRDGWPNKSAEATAVKAVDILKNATIFSSFEEATSDLQYIYATSARSRDFNKDEISSKNLSKDMLSTGIAYKKIGILFGPERSGLDNKTISKSNKIVYIPTDTSSPSINIAISTSIICYDLMQNVERSSKNTKIASQKEIATLLGSIEEILDQLNFYRVPEKKDKVLQNITNSFKRLPNFTSNEVSTFIGLFRSLISHSKKTNSVDK